MQRIWAAATTDHQWIAINGHSLRVSLPVHPGEWSQAKAAFLADLIDQVIRQMNDPEEDGASATSTVMRMISSAPISYIDEGNRVTFVLGRPDQPSTLRLAIREAYEPSLEEIVTATLRQDLDEAIARVLLDGDLDLPEQLTPLLTWGPGENQVRALLAAASGASPEQRRAVAERLARWGERWNRDQGVPEAPLELDPDQFFARWASWYQQVKNLGR
jgi:hypothetical protein